MSHTIRRSLAAAAVAAIAAVGLAAPANAVTSDLGCDPAVVAAALDAAKADVRVAQKSYTSHTKTSMQALVKQYKAEKKAEAKTADQKADRLEAQADRVKGKDGKEARAAAKAARDLARAEAKEAARIERAGVAELGDVVKAQREVLKAEWNVAKAALEELKMHADTCAATSSEDSDVEDSDVEGSDVEEPEVEEPTEDQIG